MLKVKSRTYIVFSGIIWLVAGFFQLIFGINILLYSVLGTQSDPIFIQILSDTRSKECTAVLLICFSLLMGYLLGKHFFAKSVSKIVYQILNFSYPLHLFRIYSLRYWMVLSLCFFSFLNLKHFEISYDISGSINMILGASLVIASLYYFRFAFALKKNKNSL